MLRRQFIAAAVGGTALATSGCITSAQLGRSNDPAGAANLGGNVDSTGVSTIEVTGTGRTEGEPEVARVQVSVEASGDEAEDVRAELAERSEEVVDALVAAGVDEDDITTSRYRIRDPNRTMGYEGTHGFHVEVQDIDDVGIVIDTAVDAGADDIGRVNFTLTDDTRDELRNEALELAIDDARDEAEVIAATKGVEIVGVVRVATTDSRMSPIRLSGVALDSAEAAPTEIQEGPVTVTAQVEVVYAME